MARNLKLSIVLGLMVLVSAVIVPAASAWDFRHEQKGALGTELFFPKNKVKWKFAFGQLECAEHGEGTVESLESSEDLFALNSDECSGFETNQVVLNGCEWDYISSAVNFVGTANLVCPGGGKIEFKEPGCTITVAAQNGLSSITFSNLIGAGKLVSEREITVELKVTNLTYLEDNVGANKCINPGVAQKTGTVTGPKILTDDEGVGKAVMKGTWVA